MKSLGSNFGELGAIAEPTPFWLLMKFLEFFIIYDNWRQKGVNEKSWEQFWRTRSHCGADSFLAPDGIFGIFTSFMTIRDEKEQIKSLGSNFGELGAIAEPTPFWLYFVSY